MFGLEVVVVDAQYFWFNFCPLSASSDLHLAVYLQNLLMLPGARALVRGWFAEVHSAKSECKTAIS